MSYSIDVSEQLINRMFLELKPLNDRDRKLYKGNDALILKGKDLEEIEKHLKVGENIAEPVYEIIFRAIEESSIDVDSYPLPSKLRLVTGKNSDRN